MTSRPGIDLIDRRQRLAAAMLLGAFPLPAPMPDATKAIMAAAKVCPGVTTGDVHFGDRRGALQSARALIDELLSELPQDGSS